MAKQNTDIIIVEQDNLKNKLLYNILFHDGLVVLFFIIS